MDVLTLKLLLLGFMGFVPLFFGLLPIKLMSRLSKVSDSNGSSKSKRTGISSILISFLSCFAGGVIVGVSLIELLPEARSGMEELKERSPSAFYDSLPFVEFLVGAGFLLVYFVEEFISLVFGVEHGHGDTDSLSKSSIGPGGKRFNQATGQRSNGEPAVTELKPGQQQSPPCYCSMEARSCSVLELDSTTTDDSSSSSSASPDDAAERRKAVVGAATLVLAMLVHTSLEGFAFGIQKEKIGLGSLFFGIIVHKALVFFSVGMTLVHALPGSNRLIFGLVTLLASFTPIGGITGILVESSSGHSTVKDTVATTLLCLSIGTFLYIAFFEILAPERHKQQPYKLLQWLGCALGYVFMAFALSMASHGHGHMDEHVD